MRFVGIDPSTKTGFVALDEDGNVLKQKELVGIGDVDPKRMCTAHDEVMAHLKNDDVILIEGFSFSSTGRGVDFQYGLGHSIRNTLWRKQRRFYNVAPNAVKKFVGVTGFKGEAGSKKRLKGKEVKQAVADGVMKHFGFTHPSDNVVDAYIMAQIAKALKQYTDGKVLLLPQYQIEVIGTILGVSKEKKRGAK